MTRFANIAVCAANRAGLELVQFILAQPPQIKLVIGHRSDPAQYHDEIGRACAEKGVRFMPRTSANAPEIIAELKKLEIDIVFLLWWPEIVKSAALAAVKVGWINMHPSLLPYNRGKHPYYWSIVEGTPHGVTLHLIDEGVDTGPILFQSKIDVDMTDTGETLYEKSHGEIVELFKANYAKMAALEFSPRPQDNTDATFHLSNMLDGSSRIELDKTYTGLDLINIIRARTFLNGDSAYFIWNGKKYLIKAMIQEGSQEGNSR